MIRLKTIPLAAIAVAAVLGGVGIAKAVGYFETTSSKEPVKFKTGELAGLPNPADIRGSYTWNDIEKAFGVPAAEAAAAFSAPGHALDPAVRVSVLEEIYMSILPAGLEIGTGAVRLYVSLYTGLPMEAEEGSVLPDGALAVLAKRPGVDPALLKKLVIPGSASTPAAAAPVATESAPATAGTAPAAALPATAGTTTAGAAAASTGSGGGTGTGTGTSATSAAKTVVGKTTFGNLYDWGLTEAQVEAAIGYKPGPRTQSVRDNATANGKEFSELKAALQALLDKLAP